jgi:hypothetical protein
MLIGFGTGVAVGTRVGVEVARSRIVVGVTDGVWVCVAGIAVGELAGSPAHAESSRDRQTTDKRGLYILCPLFIPINVSIIQINSKPQIKSENPPRVGADFQILGQSMAMIKNHFGFSVAYSEGR